MLQADSARGAGSSSAGGDFVLYLEGPQDMGILLAWCRRLLPQAAAPLSRASVILGGRQPARAIEHFKGLGGAEAGKRGLCVLDRDDGAAAVGPSPEAPGLEFFTWTRRHIESYLLVPEAVARVVGKADAGGRVGRELRRHLPANGDEKAYQVLDAKKLLARDGPLARRLGRQIPLARVARATRPPELHADVHSFFDAVRRELGLVEAEVVR